MAVNKAGIKPNNVPKNRKSGISPNKKLKL